MTCPCGATTTADRRRCDRCQQAAVLEALGWDEETADNMSWRAALALRRAYIRQKHWKHT